ncbi:hypothetical protein BDZ97DRAFT_1762725 [Flammula alnicola]|nr:hypothetical protein BDZ97DRAFT_1763201 [Flammula alnicola]KAF8957648.1 hypothetical protein BDZ97DRAFT_1762725 [Flammula alnicola]
MSAMKARSNKGQSTAASATSVPTTMKTSMYMHTHARIALGPISVLCPLGIRQGWRLSKSGFSKEQLPMSFGVGCVLNAPWGSPTPWVSPLRLSHPAPSIPTEKASPHPSVAAGGKRLRTSYRRHSKSRKVDTFVVLPSADVDVDPVISLVDDEAGSTSLR